MSEEVVITMSKNEAERITHGMSDLLCWTRGFKAAQGPDALNGPMGHEETIDMNCKLKEAIARAGMVKS
jgi:hypothetical protein